MLLILPFTMRESIHYAIRARQRGENIVGASSGVSPYTEYCDEYRIIPSIFEDGFKDALLDLIADYDITRFYSPHHLVYRFVSGMNISGLAFAEGDPLEIIDEEYHAAARTGIEPSLIMPLSRIYGHMSEEKLSGMVQCFSRAPAGDVLEIGCGWGKSLKALSMLATGNVYGIDPWEEARAVQQESPPIVRDSSRHINWPLMGKICKANVPEARYNTVPTSVTVLHIDGNHDYECIRSDWHTYGNLLVGGGWLILDDIAWKGVARLWDEIKGGFSDSYIKGGAIFAMRNDA